MPSVLNCPARPTCADGVPNSSIFFCHIPKCAGTAVTLRLEPAFSWENSFLSLRSSGGRLPAELTPEERNRFQAVMGHVAEAIREEFFPGLSGIVGVRNPYERFVSFYKHAARSRKFDPVLYDLTVSRDPNYFDRADRRECFRQRISSMAYLIDLETKRNFAGEEWIERQLASALQTLDRYKFVYTDDKIDIAVGELAHALGQPPLPSLPVANEASRFRQDYGDLPLDVPALFAKYFPYELEIFKRAQQRCLETLAVTHTLETRTLAYENLWKAHHERSTEFRFDPGQPFCGVNWGWRMQGKFEPYLESIYLRLNGRTGFLDLPVHPEARQIEVVLWTNDRAALQTLKLTANGIPLDTRIQREGRFARLIAPLRGEHIGETFTRLNLEIPASAGEDPGVFLYDISTSRAETSASTDRTINKSRLPAPDVKVSQNTSALTTGVSRP